MFFFVYARDLFSFSHCFIRCCSCYCCCCFFLLHSNRAGWSKANDSDRGTITTLIHSIQAKQLIFDLFTFCFYRFTACHTNTILFKLIQRIVWKMQICYRHLLFIFNRPLRHDNERRQVWLRNAFSIKCEFCAVSWEIFDCIVHSIKPENILRTLSMCCVQLEIISIWEWKKKAISNHHSNNNNSTAIMRFRQR